MKFVTIKNGCFKHNNQPLGQSITGRMSMAGKRFLKWDGGCLEAEMPCYDESKMPQGYNLAYDLDIKVGDEIYRLTIHAGAIEFALKPYLNMLMFRNCRVEDVITKISTMPTSEYTALTFEICQDPQF